MVKYGEIIWHDGQVFFSVPYNFAFQLNIDLFQPFEHTIRKGLWSYNNESSTEWEFFAGECNFGWCSTWSKRATTECCTMNLHLYCHLKECVEDYGPVYAFWLCLNEWMNGIIGSFHTTILFLFNSLNVSWIAKNTHPWNGLWNLLMGISLLKCHRYKLTFRQTEQYQTLSHCHLSMKQYGNLISWLNLLICCVNVNIWLFIVSASEAIKCGNLHSGQNSRHSQSNVIFAQKPEMTNISFAEIQYFAQCIFQPNVSSTECGRVWTVALKWYMEHPLPCMVWTSCSMYSLYGSRFCLQLHQGAVCIRQNIG